MPESCTLDQAPFRASLDALQAQLNAAYGLLNQGAFVCPSAMSLKPDIDALAANSLWSTTCW